MASKKKTKKPVLDLTAQKLALKTWAEREGLTYAEDSSGAEGEEEPFPAIAFDSEASMDFAFLDRSGQLQWNDEEEGFVPVTLEELNEKHVPADTE